MAEQPWNHPDRVEDCSWRRSHFFKVNKMTLRTDQLLKIHTWESEVDVHGQKETLIQSLKQFHACFYWWYEKGMTWAMVSLQGLHISNAFRCSNALASLELKSFFLWCLKLGANTEMIIIHLREVHYRMVIVNNMCQSFASINTQSILDHCSGCKAKCDKQHIKQEGQEKAKKPHMKKSKSKAQK